MGDTQPKAAAVAAATMNSSAFMENLRQLFGECDRDQSGSLGPSEFKELCSKIGLSAEMADETFKRLDIDRNSQITFDEFAAGFNQYKQQSAAAAASVGGSSKSTAAVAPSSPAAQQHAASGTRRTTNSPPPRFKNHLQQQQQQHQQQQQLSPSPVSTRARSRASPNRPASGGGASGPAATLSLNSTQSRSSSSTNLTGRSTSTSSGATHFDSSVTRSTSSADGFASSCDGGAPPGAYRANNNNNNNSNNNDVIVYSSDMIGGASNGDYGSGAGELAGNSGQFGSMLSSAGSYTQMKTMQDLLECVQKLQSENQILTQIFFKDKREREEYISQLGEEFDQQLREVEERANRRAKEELDAEKKRLSEMMQTERETLQHHYHTLEKLNKMVKSGASGAGGASGSDVDMAGGITKVKSQLEDTFVENRQLKKSLMDTKTDVAMIWKEMEKLKKQYESKLSSAYEKQRETQHECDHIKLQLNLMKDSNRKLQDASDVITNYIADKVEPVIKVAMDGGAGGDDESHSSLGPGGLRLNAGASSASNSRRGSILSEYLNNNEQDDDCDLESMASSNGGGGGGRLRSSASASKLMQKRANGAGLESQRNERLNLSTTSSSSNQTNDLFLNVPPVSGATPTIGAAAAAAARINQNLKASQSPGSGGKLASPNHVDRPRQQQVKSAEDTPGVKANNNKSSNLATDQQHANSRTSLKSIGRHFLMGGRTQSDPKPKEDDPAAAATADRHKSASADQADEPIVEPADGPSVATFNIILVGDSFVGKSSFAARFIEGNFVQGLISNCSIDFKTKTYKVDGTNYTVNLWDTAGQERFRSITASYFRKADGIILMYDVTEKRSYLNVRNWMSTISDTAAENVAVLLVGNKIDLRINDNKANCVPTEEGFRLAKEYEIVFLETSVKTGANLLPSMGKLLRLIAKNNTAKDEDNDRIRLSDKGRTFNCMPKNC